MLENKISKVSDVIGENENEETELDKDSELVKELYNIILKIAKVKKLKKDTYFK